MRSRIGYHQEAQRKAKVKEYNASPKGRFQAHKLNAKTRGIPFSLTFDEWWEVWKPHWADRGRGKGKYQMGRRGDVGPYSKENVYLVKHETNCNADKPRKQSQQGTRPPDEVIRKMIEGYASGKTYLAVSQEFHCSSGTVMTYVRECLRAYLNGIK